MVKLSMSWLNLSASVQLSIRVSFAKLLTKGWAVTVCVCRALQVALARMQKCAHEYTLAKSEP